MPPYPLRIPCSAAMPVAMATVSLCHPLDAEEGAVERREGKEVGERDGVSKERESESER